MNKFDEFMDEVQGDIRQAKFEKYWKLYGKKFIAICTIALGISIAYTLNGNRQEKLSLESCEQFVAAQNALMQDQNQEALVILNDLKKSAPETYKTLSMFSIVGILLKKETTEATNEAISHLKELETASFVDGNFKKMAKLIRYTHEIEMIDVTSQDFANIRLDIDKMIGQDDIWSYLAKELKGLILNRVGSFSEAAEIFIQLLQDQKTPQIIKIRAQLMAQMLTSQLKDTK